MSAEAWRRLCSVDEHRQEGIDEKADDWRLRRLLGPLTGLGLTAAVAAQPAGWHCQSFLRLLHVLPSRLGLPRSRVPIFTRIPMAFRLFTTAFPAVESGVKSPPSALVRARRVA